MAKPTRPKTKAVKRTSKRKTADWINMELDDDTDDPEVEVELDSLGSHFMHLINNDLPPVSYTHLTLPTKRIV